MSLLLYKTHGYPELGYFLVSCHSYRWPLIAVIACKVTIKNNMLQFLTSHECVKMTEYCGIVLVAGFLSLSKLMISMVVASLLMAFATTMTCIANTYDGGRKCLSLYP